MRESWLMGEKQQRRAFPRRKAGFGGTSSEAGLNWAKARAKRREAKLGRRFEGPVLSCVKVNEASAGRRFWPCRFAVLLCRMRGL